MLILVDVRDVKSIIMYNKHFPLQKHKLMWRDQPSLFLSYSFYLFYLSFLLCIPFFISRLRLYFVNKCYIHITSYLYSLYNLIKIKCISLFIYLNFDFVINKEMQGLVRKKKREREREREREMWGTICYIV